VQNYRGTELSSRQQQSKQPCFFYLLNSFHGEELVYLIVDVFECLQFPCGNVFDRPEDGITQIVDRIGEQVTLLRVKGCCEVVVDINSKRNIRESQSVSSRNDSNPVRTI
jgi:hypothetical protein